MEWQISGIIASYYLYWEISPLDSDDMSPRIELFLLYFQGLGP